VAAATLVALSAACIDRAGPLGAGECRVERVVDGDTLHVRDCPEADASIRLLLVDTPEVARGAENGECYGEEASEYMEERLRPGTVVRLEGGVRDRDFFDRYLRYLWLGDELLNETLVREGYGRRYRDAEDRTHEARIVAAEDEARAAGRGLWGACP
jgi:endonuclease YncB( thermonuclease family)